MRVDHLAYQRATNIAGLGFLLQAVFAGVLLVLGLALGDTGSVIASIWAMLGLVVWVGLLIVFNQHRLERLESLEADELLASGGEAALFEGADGIGGVAARRLRMLYRWVLPTLSLGLAVGLGVAGWLVLAYLTETRSGEADAVFEISIHRGWLIAIDIAFGIVAFIFSRFLAGMAEFSAWRNLRSGAGIMVGNALVCLAIAIAVVFSFFDIPGVIEGVAWGIPVFMFAVAIEIVLAIVLNAYRPRIAGEFPRAAFDSRTLSLLSRPDSFVRSINEAVNYQFGFDITSSWGYQLVLRSGVWLAGLSIVSLLAMSTLVVVGGREEGLRLRAGRIIPSSEGDVQSPGAFWKLPWPIEYATLHDVTEVRSLSVTPAEEGISIYDDWSKPAKLENKAKDYQFIVRPSQLGQEEASKLIDELDAADDGLVSNTDIALVRARIVLGWRVKGDDDALLQYLDFGTDRKARRQRMTDRQRILRSISIAEATRFFATLNLDDVLTTDRGNLGTVLKDRIQKRLDTLGAGIDVVNVSLPMVLPPADAVQSFEDLPVAVQQNLRTIRNAEREKTNVLNSAVGNPVFLQPLIEAVDAVESARLALSTADAVEHDAAQKRLDEAVEAAEVVVRKGGGAAYQIIAAAERGKLVDMLARRGQAARVRGQQSAWVAAPQLFRQRSIMKLYAQYLPSMRKYVIGVDPSKLELNVELRELASPNTVFSESLLDGTEGQE
ncbi:MAG: SPFH domain-containing protein [Phycisphaerales bacterium]|nr:SPFH domain-containing protein [Phycisphaerales bacterium]